MTGLDYDNDVIIEIACFVTDYDMNLLEPDGFEVVIHQPQEVMDAMGEWCTQHHGDSGLTAAVLASSISPDQAAQDLLSYIQQYLPEPRRALLAGNSVHADAAFLRKAPYDKIIKHLHYRILDVSSFKEAARRWAPKEVLTHAPGKKGLHTARADILESIVEAKFYRDIFFRKPSQ
jgi:oligoribonuclease